MAKIIYIAGYGRSGSTALELMMSKEFGCKSIGEISSIYSEVLRYEKSLCGCLSTYKDCKVWGAAIRDLSTPDLLELEQLTRFYQMPLPVKSVYFFYFLFLLKKAPTYRNYRKAHIELMQYAERNFCSIHSPLIDSSKSSWFAMNRPLLLKKMGHDVVIIHIVRPYSGVVTSVNKGDNKWLAGEKRRNKRFRVARSLLTYLSANYIANRLNKDFPYMRVFQPELFASPKHIMSEVKSFLLANNFELDRNCCEIHLVAGNRMKKT